MQWIDPNDKTQKKYLPHIGEKCIFAHGGKTYYGHHTGGSFQCGVGVTAKHFGTWDCVWMPMPEAPNAKAVGLDACGQSHTSDRLCGNGTNNERTDK